MKTHSFVKKSVITTILFLCLFPSVYAQAGFGFGSDDADSGVNTTEADPSAESRKTGVSTGGKLTFNTMAFIQEEVSEAPLEADATGRLFFTARNDSVDTLLRLRLDKKTLTNYPEDIVEEASLRVYMGRADIEGGLLKVVWGKADSQGPLDVLNPVDLSDLSVTDSIERKIAQPMLKLSFSTGIFSTLEAVFIPGFTADRIALDGPWAAAQIRSLKISGYNYLYSGTDPTANYGAGNGLYYTYMMNVWSTAYAAAYSQFLTAVIEPFAANTQAIAAANAAVAAQSSLIASQAGQAANDMLERMIDFPDTHSLEYAQGGLRFATTLGSVDMALQYFTGFLQSPVIQLDPAGIYENGVGARVSYNRYHQAGIDAAAVVAGFNLRSEFAANITEDIKGDDPLVYNPHLAWSIGFDRDISGNININVQYNGTWRMNDEKTDANLLDVEYGKNATKTKITSRVSQKLFKDAVEWEVTGICGIEDMDFLVMPKLGYIFSDARLEISGGIFGGDSKGELGQFKENYYARLSLSYTF